MKYLNLILVLIFYSCSSKQNKIDINGLIVDPTIKNEVEKHISQPLEWKDSGDFMQVYGNSLSIEGYENDSLVISSTDFSKKLPFRSFYLWDKDTLGINGAYGLFGGTGFYIKIANKKAKLFHMLSSDDFPTYAYKEKDSLIMRLEVPCTDTKIVLSELPDSTKNRIIYGFVEFKSDSFYSASDVFIKGEEPQRKKIRNNMKIYFKSGLLKIN
ncbi:hypothetical protein [Tenacibaculum sp. 190524A05c]|uniref:Lipoprotein n=1 Tax=Tenacibaculum platacis TaxID=3137852 RepID=A0ABM9P3U6_9FLAO